MKIKTKRIILLLILLVLTIFVVLKFINNDKVENNSANLEENKHLNNNDNNDDNDNNAESNEKKAKLTLVGDFLFEQPYYDSINKGDDKNVYFRKVKKYFLDDDLSIGNMEVVIGNDNLEVSGTGYNFCAPEYIGDLVSTLDLEVLSTANNHAYDRGKEGIDSSIDYFKNNTDIMTLGTYKNEDDINKEHIITKNGISFGFLAYTYGTNRTPSKDMQKYISTFKDPNTKEITNEYKEKIKEDVTKLRSKVDVIIAIMHWGVEFTYTPNAEQKEMANYLNSLGVDIILGSHSHSIEPIEWINKEHKTLVYYSMGNFVSADDDISRTGETFDNAYQMGLLSQLEVIKKDNNIKIDNVKTNLIINYYDNNMRNFELVPLDKYSSTYEKNHYRYQYNFNKEFINSTYEKVIAKEFR